MPRAKPVATRARTITKLSLSLLLEIFLYLTSETRVGLLLSNGYNTPRFVVYAPALELRRVCRFWNAIVSVSPSLYSTFQILGHLYDPPTSLSMARVVTRLLKASQRLPLHVTLLSHGRNLSLALRLVFLESERWASAELYFNGLTFNSPGFNMLYGRLPNIRRLRLVALDRRTITATHAFLYMPRLRHFEIQNRRHFGHPQIQLPLTQLTSVRLGGLDYFQCMTLLSYLPRLNDLALSGMGPFGKPQMTGSLQQVTTQLKSLTIRPDCSVLGVLAFFRHVDMPNIEALDIRDLCATNSTDQRMLSETLIAIAPLEPRRTLKKLALKCSYVPAVELTRMLMNLPSLTHLDISLPSRADPDDIPATPALIGALQTEDALLPELAFLKITAEGYSGQGMNFAFLLRMARSRMRRTPREYSFLWNHSQSREWLKGEPKRCLRKLEFSTSDDWFLPSMRQEVQDLQEHGMTVCLKDMYGFVDL